MSFEQKLDGIVARHSDIAATLAAGSVDPQDYARLSKEYAELTPVVESIGTLHKATKELADL